MAETWNRVRDVRRQEVYRVVDVLSRIAEKEPPCIDQALKLWRIHY